MFLAEHSEAAYRQEVRAHFKEKKLKSFVSISQFLNVSRDSVSGWFNEGGTTKARLKAGLAICFFKQSGVFVHSSIATPPIFLQIKLSDCSMTSLGKATATLEEGDETETEGNDDPEEDEGDSEEDEDDESMPANAKVTLLSLTKLQRTQHVKGATNLSKRKAATVVVPALTHLARPRTQTQEDSEQKRRNTRLPTTPQTVHTHSHTLVLATHTHMLH